MESSGEAFDVVAVVIRAQRMRIKGAPEAELAWADRAADHIRAWVDAWQAEVQFEQTLPRPLPDPEASDAAAEPDPTVVTDAADDTDRDTAADDLAGDAHCGEPLPSLGPEPDPHESHAERERKARRTWLLSALPAFLEALRARRITTGHVDVLAVAADRLPVAIRDRVLARGDELLAAAVCKTPEKFSRTIQTVIAKDRKSVVHSFPTRRSSDLDRKSVV